MVAFADRLDELHLKTPLRILGVVVVAVVLTIVVKTFVRRLTSRVIAIPGANRDRLKVRQRAIGTVLRSTAIGLIWATTLITVVSELGVNIGAFVATATVIGGALAFGAQTLVRDAVAGFFVIAEDQYGVGDSVDVGHAVGVVERITLRSVRLRDGDGRVWHVPHGGIIRTANLSKSPKAVLDLDVARTSHLLDLDVEATRLCQALADDPAVKSALDGKPAADGIIDVKDDRLVYRLSVVTKPGKADEVRRAWRIMALMSFESGALMAPITQPTVLISPVTPEPHGGEKM